MRLRKFVLSGIRGFCNGRTVGGCGEFAQVSGGSFYRRSFGYRLG